MAEYTGEAEEEFTTDIDINFLEWTPKKRMKLIQAVSQGKIFTFEKVLVLFSGEVTIDIEPQDYH